MALAPAAREAFPLQRPHADLADDESPLVEGCPCPACTAHTRAYVHYLARAEELTGVRLLTLHNLAYTEALVAGAREAIRAGSFERYREAVLGGETPWAAARSFT